MCNACARERKDSKIREFCLSRMTSQNAKNNSDLWPVQYRPKATIRLVPETKKKTVLNA